MIVVGIESSCDETSVAFVDSERQILSNVIHSQIATHAEYGGVVPEIAAREHLEKIRIVFDEAIAKAEIGLSEIDAVAATCGPGLIGGLIVGSSFAKGLAVALSKPFLPINHLFGHALTPRLSNADLEFPYLLLLASGGHCFIAEILSQSNARLLGSTIDDSAGECLDKVAKMLGLGYPGGPAVERMATFGNELAYNFPTPLSSQKNCNFSFSGLKTSVLYKIKESEEPNDKMRSDICASLQNAIARSLLDRLKNAIPLISHRTRSLAFAGGVSANKYINQRIAEFASNHGLKFYNSPTKLCTDNGAMIAWCGIEQFTEESALDFEPRPRWPIG